MKNVRFKKRREVNKMNFRILSACNGGILEVFGTGSSVRIPVTDFNLKSSADGTVELNLTIKGYFNEFEPSASLTQVKQGIR